MPRAELRTTDPATVARWLAAYGAALHPVEVEVNHRLDETDNEIVFRVADWDAFTAIMDEDERARPAS
ncbi:MAG: hypothetical protein AB7G21_07630 [Dehalococcoidia bacterium]